MASDLAFKTSMEIARLLPKEVRSIIGWERPIQKIAEIVQKALDEHLAAAQSAGNEER